MMLSARSHQEEQMDGAELDEATYTRILSDLARVNTVTLARRPTLNFLDRVVHEQGTGKCLRIVDVGFGDGDMLRAIARWAWQRGVEVELVGVDINPKSAAVAVAATADVMAIDYQTGDYADLSGGGWDVIVSSLVAHHMTHEQLIAFLRFMEREARAGWFINDLHRHGFAWWGYPLLARLFGWHHIVRQDGQLSIARSYKPAEWPPMLVEAGVSNANVNRVFPFRLCVSKIR